MKCPVCSHVYPDTLSRCSRCGRVAPGHDGVRDSGSLIEFPRDRSHEALARGDHASLPDWRVELNEKVRAIKARRSMQARVEEATSSRQQALPPPPEPEPPLEELQPEEPSNPIVAAALNRVRRASENAARAHVAAPARREATAPRIFNLPAPRPEPEVVRPAPPPSVPEPRFDPAEFLDGLDDDLELLRDPLEEEVASIARKSAEGQRPAPIVMRMVAGVIDLAVICVASAPFVATVELAEGDFARSEVRALLVSTIVLLVAFYLFVSLALDGRTTGMRFSRIRVVSVASGETPAPRAVLLRVLGFFVATVPLGLGLVWALFNRERRGWHDLLSGTRVVEG